MSRELDRLVAISIQLHVQLFAAQERLQGYADPHALHDMRVAIRRLRSLLRPLRNWAVGSYLDRAAQAVADFAGPLRDSEVLLQELAEQVSESWRNQTQIQLCLGYRQLLRRTALKSLHAALDTWPAEMRQLQQEGAFKQLSQRIDGFLHKQVDILSAAISATDFDRHQLRLLVKKMRYGLEAYPGVLRAEKQLLPKLKRVQSMLGDWHDRWQWLQLAEQEPELLIFVPRWQAELEQYALQAESALLSLKEVLGNSTD